MLLIIIIFINFISILVFVLIVFLMSSFIFEGIRSVWHRFRLFFLGFGKAVNFIFIVRVGVIR